MENYRIKLMDGREIEGFLKSEQPSKIEKDALKLDRSGEYLSFNRHHPKTPSDDVLQRARRQYHHYLFTENAWFLLANAEKIFSDSRMFFAPVNIVNGLAYTGRSGFGNPTIGVYLEWWLNYQEASIDKNGNLVWFISGSPLSGSNCCSSVTQEGKHEKIAQRTPFSSIWSSFINVNKRYTEARQRCEAYTIEEVLIKLHGEDYRYRIVDLQHEMIEMVMEWDKNILERVCGKLRSRITKLMNSNKRIQLRQNYEAIKDFYKGYLQRQKEVCELEKEYVAKHKELKRQLHSGTLEGSYHWLLAEASRIYRQRRREQSESLNKFIRDVFRDNPNEITPADVIKYAKKIV